MTSGEFWRAKGLKGNKSVELWGHFPDSHM